MCWRGKGLFGSWAAYLLRMINILFFQDFSSATWDTCWVQFFQASYITRRTFD